jgi:hypothetical protein
MTKSRLLATLQAKRTEWEAVVADFPAAHLTDPSVAKGWSVKDIIAHLAHYERWIAERLEEHLRGETYVPTEMDDMDFNEANILIFQANRDRALADVQAESQQVFQRLVAAIEAHSEEFLIEPQHFAGMPEPIAIWMLIRSNVYDHYREHMPAIKTWLAAHAAEVACRSPSRTTTAG